MDDLALPKNETGSMCWLVSLLTALAGKPQIYALFEGSPVGQVLHNMATLPAVSAKHLLAGMWAHGQHDAGEYFLTSCPQYCFQTVRNVTRTYANGKVENESFKEDQKVESLAHYGKTEFTLSKVFPREEVTTTDACTVRTLTSFVSGEVLVFITDPHSSKHVDFEPELVLNENRYKLVSVIVWRGQVGSGGHYAAYVHRGQKWHFCDDGHVHSGLEEDTPETFPAQGMPLYTYAPLGYRPQYKNNLTGEVITLETREALDEHKADHGGEMIITKSAWAPSRHGTFFLYCLQK